ncbi:IS110 family transposase [Alteromonas sp. KUL106]|uniref:IS110 family transposase n=1 Tax=Alteromonas sp. KUL106 TaxID=2480799 RepID=UPI0012E42803|nr:IS110 family transposase [Alteromonas sp. KUL106]GFD70537.1 IS110 family transposase [Alteromonas sp. KUL106]GFD83906.1 IS110 family transposase [Tenacibaculum sp. KUL118]
MNKTVVQNINVGVDTGKDFLDIHIRPLNEYFKVSNNKKGIGEAIKRLRKLDIERVVIESTGRYEAEFVAACAKTDIPFSVVNPVHVKRFAGAIGRRAKTDKLDAALIAQFGEVIQPKLSTLKSENMQKMADIVRRRNQLIEMQTKEKNRLQIMPKSVQSSIKAIIVILKKHIEKMNDELAELIESCPDYSAKSELVQSMPGIGKVSAAALISYLPELGLMNSKQVAALVGVAPMSKESGKYKGKQVTQGGRHQVRTVLFMAMMSAMQCNLKFKTFYERLVEAGKPKKVAIIACVRKMVVILNSMVRDGVMWEEKAV